MGSLLHYDVYEIFPLSFVLTSMLDRADQEESGLNTEHAERGIKYSVKYVLLSRDNFFRFELYNWTVHNSHTDVSAI
jgi:hypothetical protein